MNEAAERKRLPRGLKIALVVLAVVVAWIVVTAIAQSMITPGQGVIV